MTKFIEFLKGLIKRPGMFFINKVEDYNLIITGYLYGAIEENSQLVAEFVGKFNQFVNKELGTGKEQFEWFKLIRLYSGSDAHSIVFFSELFERFLECNETNS